MAKFCFSCGEPMGTRQLLHDSATCDPCRERAALGPAEKRAKSGLLRFVEEVETRNPLSGTGRLRLAGSGPED